MRSDWWVPSVQELILFVTVIALIIILIRLFHHNKVQKTVRATSRCVRERELGYRSGVYTVNAYNKDNEPLYKVTYNTETSDVTVDCACKPGTAVSTFRNIKYFNLRDPANGNQVVPEKLCECQKPLSNDERVYYRGYPGLIRYMYSGDETFFYDSLNKP
jgi:hypothetical protein